MNESTAYQLVLDAQNERDRQRHQAVLDNPVELERYRSYSWWDESSPELEDSVDWGAVDGLNVTVHGTVVQVVEQSGGEGQGDHAHVVVKFTNKDGVEYWKKDGYYASHYGTDWDGEFYKVRVVKRLVTFYE